MWWIGGLSFFGGRMTCGTRRCWRGWRGPRHCMNELSKAIEDIVGLFDSLALQYAIMGGIAVRVYGIPRATYDVDFTAAISRESLPELFRRVQALGYSVPEPF